MKKIILFCLSLVLMTIACKDDNDLFTRENDLLSVDCTEQTIEQNFLCQGNWTADCSNTDWITITPQQGGGNGTDYGTYAIHIQYNSGEQREGVVYLIYNGVNYPITITQGKCEFAYGNAKVEGNLFKKQMSEALIKLPYTCASGQESVSISGSLSGDGAQGLTIQTATYDQFQKGTGELVIPIVGTPLHAGSVTVQLAANGTVIGTCSFNVVNDPSSITEGLPVGWNFYQLTVDGGPRGSAYDYSWTTNAVMPTGITNPLNEHKVLPSYGNKDAYLTASGVISDNANYTFNPGIQIKGLLKDDYFLFVIPVKNIGPDNQLTVEASMGAAGSGPGYYALEYSADNKNWNLAAGSSEMDVFGAKADVHYYVPTENTSTDRKTYNKETDKGYRKYTFPLTGMEKIVDGNLYLRLRICMDRRANGSETTNTIAVAWADLKGFEVTLVED